VDLRRPIDGDRCDRNDRWFDQRNCTKKFASAETTNRLHITGGEGDDGTGIGTGTGTGIGTGIGTSTSCCTDLSGRANSNSASADGVEQPNLGMHDKRAKNIFR
jgi:hypothetical protein